MLRLADVEVIPAEGGEFTLSARNVRHHQYDFTGPNEGKLYVVRTAIELGGCPA